jgi:hypothetical protein
MDLTLPKLVADRRHVSAVDHGGNWVTACQYSWVQHSSLWRESCNFKVLSFKRCEQTMESNSQQTDSNVQLTAVKWRLNCHPRHLLRGGSSYNNHFSIALSPNDPFHLCPHFRYSLLYIYPYLVSSKCVWSSHWVLRVSSIANVQTIVSLFYPLLFWPLYFLISSDATLKKYYNT